MSASLFFSLPFFQKQKNKNCLENKSESSMKVRETNKQTNLLYLCRKCKPTLWCLCVEQLANIYIYILFVMGSCNLILLFIIFFSWFFLGFSEYNLWMTSCLWIPTKLNQTKASGFSAMTTGPIALQSPSWHYWGMHELCFGFFIIILKINLLLVTKIKKFISESCYFYCLNNICANKSRSWRVT